MSCKGNSSGQKPVSFITNENSYTTVYNNLLGTAFANNNLVVLENHKVLFRRDHRTMTGKVKILAGGGAGLEPAEAGCIGQGMLTAAVFGEVFVAPPSSSILIAIRELAFEHPDGILLLVKNYLGDKLNFGLALERALTENITIKMILIGDDSASPDPGKNGRRGLAGSILVYKIAGGMAEAGKSLDDIFNVCRELVSTDLSTISMCLSPSSNLKWHSFQTREIGEEIIIGIGAYGQPGVKVKYRNLNDTISIMLDAVTNPSSKTSITTGEAPVVVLVNNLGATSKLEEGVICTEIINELLLRKFTIARFFSGTFMSLMDSKGFSFTMLKVTDPETLRFLDAPTAARNWPTPNFTSTDKFYCTSRINESFSFTDSITVKPVLNHKELDNLIHANLPLGPALPDCSKSMRLIITFAAEALISCEKQINVIDLEVGDGDAGTMLKNGAVALKEALEEGQINLTHPCKLLLDVANIVERYIGGITGALYKTFFSSASTVFQNANDINLQTWFEAFESGVKAVKYYGGAEIGERTLLDALWPVIDVLKTAVQKDEEIHRTVSNVACTCEYYAEETKKIKPFHIRGNYPLNNLIYPDAGAHAAAVWMRAICEAFDPDLPVPSPSIFVGEFLTQKEAEYILNQDITKKEIMEFFDDKLGTDSIQQVLLFDTALYCRKHYGNSWKKASSLITIMHYSHLYFTASRWRTPDETYNYFKESLLRRSMEYPPTCVEIFEPEEAREALLFFIEIYLRNAPLTRLICLPHYRLRLKIKNESESSGK